MVAEQPGAVLEEENPKEAGGKLELLADPAAEKGRRK